VSTLPPLPAPETASREELLRTLDRETAVARATEGKLAVLVIELRRVDRLQALLRGPAPAMTMSLVLERLRKALRPDDRLAALGDDQVCVLLPRLAHASQAVLAAVKLLRALDRPIAHEGGAAVLRPCVGIATLPEHGFDPAELLMAADVSRQIAATREEGYHVYQAEDTSVEGQLYRGLDLDLERAIRGNELQLRYAPQADTATGAVVGAEARLLWRHDAAGEVTPASILSIAERTGQASALALWVLNAALRQHAQWRDAGVKLRLSVAIVAGNLNDREFPGIVDQVVKTWGTGPGELVLQMPESAMGTIVEAERQQAMLTRLQASGVQLGIDEFGSGFTSLAALRRLPIVEVRLDSALVAALPQAAGHEAVIGAALDIARRFGLRTAAVGVDDAATLARLRELGCDLAQGSAVGETASGPKVRDEWSHVIKPAP
jgi:EAL domain-containing protein (putative c-di-GMP-specific phosphodiesterase class I)/GGDEF domain-containing protein